MRRVAITGIGVISALGLNQTEFWQSLQSGCSGVRPIKSIDASQIRFKNAAEVPGYIPKTKFLRDDLAFMDRFAQFAVLAAREAITQAGAGTDSATARESGHCHRLMHRRPGGGREAGYWELFHNGRSRIHPLTIPLGMSNAGASHISMRYRIRSTLHGLDGLFFFWPTRSVKPFGWFVPV